MTDNVPSNFIRTIIEDDLRSGRHQQVVTRFPPEPNGFLHIGHAKAICISFGMAEAYGGRCHLRMDDTNPAKEEEAFVRSIEADIRWLGFEWGEHRYNASDYFDQLYAWARLLIEQGDAYVDEQAHDDIRAQRGTVEDAGTASPYRDRPAAESLERFEEMKAGVHPDGAMVLRAKIDMSSPNMQMRDPIMYRIRNQPHHRTGDTWHIYPMYDWAHGQSDAIEGITHSLCSLEFENNRELYDWYLAQLPVPSPPHQYEFARLALTHTLTSKRTLRALVDEGRVDGWDDPRMPTLAGLRRRGVTPSSIRRFIDQVGVSKANSVVDPAFFDAVIRDELNHASPRVMAVLDPIEVVVEDWEPGEVDVLEASAWPADVPNEGSRPVPFSRRLFIERDDFAVTPPAGFKRLAPGRSVRLRYAYIFTYTGHDLDDAGQVVRIRGTVDRTTRGGTAPAGTKVWATLHWVDADRSVPVEVRLYDRLFRDKSPGKHRDFRDDLNPDSLTVLTARAEPSVEGLAAGQHVQFERTGYFYTDADSVPGAPVFNRVVPLKDTWAKRNEGTAPRVETQQTHGERVLSETAQALVARGLAPSQAQALEGDADLMRLFDDAVAVHDNPKGVAGWVVTEIARETKGRDLGSLALDGAALGRLVALVDADTLTNATAKVVFREWVASGADPEAIVAARGLDQVVDPTAVIDEVIAAFPDKVTAYQGGNTRLLGFFIGQVMQRTDGRAPAQTVRSLLQDRLA